jgi:hypothetical protein
MHASGNVTDDGGPANELDADELDGNALDISDCGPLAPARFAVERSWEVVQSNYGLAGPGLFGIAPDASEIVLSGREYAPSLYHFRAADGSRAPADSVFPLWRDPLWTIQGEGNGTVTVRSLASGLPIMMLTGGSAPSGDGRRVISFSCQNQQANIQALAAAPSGTPEAGQVIGGGCPSGNLAASASGDAVLYSVGGSGELHRVALATGAHTSIRAHPDAPPALAGNGLAIKLAPRESAVATVGYDAVLRLWSYPGLERIGSDIPTMWTTNYTNCYCTPRSFAPVSWSSDDALLAMSDSEGTTVIRRVCDGAIVATVPDPTPTLRPPWDRTGKWGPTFLAFGPGDKTLAVFYEGSLALYRLQRP